MNVVIIGAGGHAKVISDIIQKNGDTVLGYLDDDTKKIAPSGLNILGTVAEYEKFCQKASFIIAIGNNSVRKRLAQTMKCSWYTAVHPMAAISAGAKIGEGSCLMAGAVVNADAVIGKHTIINSSAVVEHDCHIGDFVHLSPNSTVCGNVCVEESCWIGAGATVINGIKIGANTTIGAGAVVIENIESGGTFVGVPARRIGL